MDYKLIYHNVWDKKKKIATVKVNYSSSWITEYSQGEPLINKLHYIKQGEL